VPPAIAIVVAPLFFEAHMESMVEKIIVVVADDEIRLRRLQARDGLDESAIRARFAAQLSPEVQKQRADWVIDNSGSLEETERQVEKIWKELQGG
jgi:dephospho-CoA kinase